MEKKHLSMIVISLLAALSGLLFGFDTGVISGAILFINQNFSLLPSQTEWVISVVLLGALFGAVSSGRLTDRYGRKRLLMWSSLLFILGTLISSLATNILTLECGRFLLGLAIGNSSFTTPLYLAEISQKEKRGFMVALYQLAITIGILLSYFVNLYYAPIGAWRMMLGFGIIPASLLLISLFFVPESPRYLLSMGFLDKAKAVLCKLRSSHEVEQELYNISLVKNDHDNWKTLIFDKHFRRVLTVGITLASLQQITGINTIIYYAPTIFKLSDFSTHNAFLATLLVGLVNMLVSIIVLPLVDTLGRRKLLMSGLSGMMISLMLLGLSVSFSTTHPHLKPLMPISMMLYIACFAFSLGPMTFVLISEIFPLAIRGFSMSLAIGANWLSNMLVAITFLSLIQAVGLTNTFYFYAACCLVALSFVYFFVPETKGVSLEKIENNLFSGVQMSRIGLDIEHPKNTLGETHAARK